MKPFKHVKIKQIFQILFLLYITLCANVTHFSTKNFKTALADISYYAQISTDQTYLYSDTSLQNTIFLLPQTYFVELLSAVDDCYYAKYNDIYGYVKKDQVKPIKNIPQNPFLQNISFRVFVPSGANLRSTPQNLGAVNLVYSIPFLETNLLYYGIAYGEEAISKKGNIWYYCKYYVNNLSYTGYVYSPLCDSLSTITNNQETIEFLESEPIFSQVNTSSNSDGMQGLSQTAQTIIIVAVSLPCLLFIYLLFKPTRIAEQQSSSSNNKTRGNSRNKKKISRLKHSDYYEFDDDFLN